MISFLGGQIEHPDIIYYENEKKNAIAPKITSKAKTSVQEQVNASFVSTLAEAMMQVGDAVAGNDVDKPETVEQRLRVYHEQTQPLIDYYTKEGILKEVDGTIDLEDVFAEITKILG